MNYSYCCGLDHRSTFLFQYQVKTKQKPKKPKKTPNKHKHNNKTVKQTNQSKHRVDCSQHP